MKKWVAGCRELANEEEEAIVEYNQVCQIEYANSALCAPSQNESTFQANLFLKPIRTFDDTLIYHQGIMKHMVMYTESHEDLCKKKYGIDVLLTILKTNSSEKLDETAGATLVHYVLTQYSMKAAMQKNPGEGQGGHVKGIQTNSQPQSNPADAC